MIDFLAWLIALPLIAILAYLAFELLFGLRRLNGDHPVMEGADIPRTTILIPAHDEQSGIAATVQAARTNAPWAEVLVVADNCSDGTADVARGAGAQVTERNDRDRRGKGFALAHGRDLLMGLPNATPQAVIVLDADCRIAPGSAERLARRAVASNRPVQAANLLTSQPDSPPMIAISNFAMLVKNLVRARGLMRLGGGALLFGTGMAFPWQLFARLDLATGNAVEDLDLGLNLARSGISVALEDAALVTSPPASQADSRGQRSRWEHGFLDTARSSALPLIRRGLARGSRSLISLGAHLLVPPLALLMAMAGIGLVTVTILGALGDGWSAPIALAVILAIVIMLLLVAWWREGRGVLSAGTLLRIPLYILWKLPIYAAFLIKRQTGWNRTPRDDDKA